MASIYNPWAVAGGLHTPLIHTDVGAAAAATRWWFGAVAMTDVCDDPRTTGTGGFAQYCFPSHANNGRRQWNGVECVPENSARHWKALRRVE